MLRTYKGKLIPAKDVCALNFRHKNNKVKVQFKIVPGNLVLIIEFRTCKALNLIKRINSPEKPVDSNIEQFSDVSYWHSETVNWVQDRSDRNKHSHSQECSQECSSCFKK